MPRCSKTLSPLTTAAARPETWPDCSRLSSQRLSSCALDSASRCADELAVTCVGNTGAERADFFGAQTADTGTQSTSVVISNAVRRTTGMCLGRQRPWAVFHGASEHACE